MEACDSWSALSTSTIAPPWGTVCSHCFAEVESLREQHEELRAARGAYLEAEPELTNAVIGDCLQVVLRSFNPSLGD